MLYQKENWRIPMFSVVALGVTTYLIYPVFYDHILNAETWALVILLLRNLGYVALLVWANRELISLRTNSPIVE
jgi:hypothetical protein